MGTATNLGQSFSRRHIFSGLWGGMRLAAPGAMSIFVFPCDRCGEYRAGDSYRVVSDSDGVRLLDMIVCYGCYIEASQLGLDTETIEISELALH
jgi:hypothetical protein